MRGCSAGSDSRIPPALQQRREPAGSSVTHRATRLVTRRGQGPPPSLADSAHSFTLAKLPLGAAEAVNTGEWQSRKEKSVQLIYGEQDASEDPACGQENV